MRNRLGYIQFFKKIDNIIKLDPPPLKGVGGGEDDERNLVDPV